MDIPKKKGGRPSKRPPDEVIVKLYKQYTSSEIAEKYGVKPGTVRSWISLLRKGK